MILYYKENSKLGFVIKLGKFKVVVIWAKLFPFSTKGGGLGKTTTAINLSAGLGKLGKDTMLVI